MAKEKGSIDNFIDNIFDLKKPGIYIAGIFLLGLILRFIAAINLSVSADDMHFVTHAINFLSSDKFVTYDQSSGLWFMFTDLMFKIFGYTQFSSRIASIIFGSLSVIALYMLCKEFFNEKISLLAAFLLAIAPFHIKLSIAEQDVMAMFFVLMAMFLFVRAIRVKSNWTFALAGILMGIAIYTKVYPVLFIPSMLIYWVYVNRRSKTKIMNKGNVKAFVLFLFFLLLFTIPALAHNYLLYKEKGFMDLQFTRTFDLGRDISAQYYSWDHQFEAENDWRGLILGDSSNSGSTKPTLLLAINYIRVADPIIFYLGALGILILLFYKKREVIDRKYLVFFLASIVFALPFLASIILLPKHYVFLEILLVPLAAISLNEITRKVTKSPGTSLKIALIFLLILSLIFLGLPKKNTVSHFYGESGVSQVIEFKNKEISKNSLIVADSRIYRGQIHWMLHGRPYIEGSEFVQIINQPDSFSGDEVSIKLYYIECAVDDCGWGTIVDQPEFNSSMESLTQFIAQQGRKVKTINEPNRESPYYPIISTGKKINAFNIYEVDVSIKRDVLAYALQPKEWFLYTIGYLPKEKQFDYYSPEGFVNNAINTLAGWIVTLALIISILSIPYTLFLILRK